MRSGTWKDTHHKGDKPMAETFDYTNLFDVKNYLRVDHEADDAYIRQLITAADVFIKAYTDDLETLPEDLQQAVLLMISHWYDQRSIIDNSKARQTGQEMAFTLSALLANHKVQGF